VLCTVETRDRDHIAEVQRRLADEDIELVSPNMRRNPVPNPEDATSVPCVPFASSP